MSRLRAHSGPARGLLVTLLSFSLATEALADSRTDARRYFTRGMDAIQRGAYAEGVDQLLKAYAIRPHPNVLYNVARAYASLGELKEAIDYFERYLASGPRDAERVSEAIADLRLRRELRALVDEGMAAIDGGRYAEGVAALQKAYNQRPHPNLLYNIARAQEQLGETALAISNFEAYLRSDPRDATDVRARLDKLRAAKVAEADVPPKPPLVPVRPKTTEVRPEEVAAMVVELLERRGAVGAQPAPVAVREVPTATVSAEVDLEAKEGAGYEEVVVTASRREQSPLDAPNAVTLITEEEIRLSGARSIPDLLRRVPGLDVMAMSYADWNVASRGFNRRIANKMLVLVDGRTAYEDFLGGMVWLGQSYDLADIARIEVVRGPGSAIYGANAYSGIVNIILKRPGDINRSVLTAGGGNGSILRASYQFGKQRGPIGIRVSAGFEQGDKFEFEVDPKRVDFTAAEADSASSIDRSIQLLRADVEAEYNFDNGGRLFVGAGLSGGYLEFYGVSALRNQNYDGNKGNVRLGYDSEIFSLHAYANMLRTDTKPQFFRTGLPDLGSTVKADLIVVEPVFRPSFSLAGEHQLVLGAEYRHKLIDWDYIDAKQEESHVAAFLQDSWNIDASWTVVLSYRLDVHPLIGVIEQPDLGLPGSPRLAIILKPTERQAVRASIGTAFRQPTIAETYLDLSAASPVAGVAVNLVGGREALLPEDIITAELGYLNQQDFGEFELVAYLNRVNNLITRSPLRPTPPSLPFEPEVGFIGAQSFYLNEDRVFLAIGSEASARLYPIDGLDVGASYAFQYIFDADTGDRFTDSPLHKITLWTQYRSAFGLDVAAAVHFVSEQDWIEPEFDAADPSGFRLDPQRVDANTVLMARVGYRLFEDQLELAVSGTNLLDVGSNRHIEHPFANKAEARVVGSMTVRF